MTRKVEIVKRGVDASNRRDVAAPVALSTNDFVWVPARPGAVEGGSYHGRDGIEKCFAEGRDPRDESKCAVASFAITTTESWHSVGSVDAGSAAASRSMRSLRLSSSFAMTRSHAFAHI
jgi:ketosteroid isomerase-like protein